MNEDKAIGSEGGDGSSIGRSFAKRVLQRALQALRRQGSEPTDALATVLAQRAAFLALSSHDQAEVLKWLVNTGVQNERKPARLGPDEMSLSLQCAWTLSLGETLVLAKPCPIDPEDAIQSAERCHDAFAALGNKESQRLVLHALIECGVEHARSSRTPEAYVQALARFSQVFVLALDNPLRLSAKVSADEAACDVLDFPGSKHGGSFTDSVASALFNEGLAYSVNSHWIPGAEALSLARWTQVWTLVLGDALPLPQKGHVGVAAAVNAAIHSAKAFDAKSTVAKRSAVAALLNAASVYCRRGSAGLAVGKARAAQAVTLALGDILMLRPTSACDLGGCTQTRWLGRNAYSALDSSGQQNLVSYLSTLGNGDLGRLGQAARLALLTLLPRTVEQIAAWTNAGKSTIALHNCYSPALAANWICRGGALPTRQDAPGQMDTVLQLTSQLLAMERRQSGPLGRLVREAGQGQPDAAAVARALAQQQGWPVVFEDQAHWVLALGLVRRAVPCPSLDPAWAIDASTIARACQWLDCRLDDGHARRSYVLAPPPAPANPLDTTRWKLGDAEHARWAQWLGQLADTGSSDEAQAAMQDWWAQALPVAQTMCAWRQGWLPHEEFDTAWQHSARALLLAQADRFVEQVWAQCTGGLPSWPRGLPLTAEHPASADSMANLWLSWLGPGHSLMSERLLQAQHYWADHRLRLSAEPAVVWRLLELSRHQLLPATPASARWQDWDAEALRALEQAELRVLRDARARLAAIEQRQPEPPNCLNSDQPIEPFATMAQQWTRMGVGLDIPTPAAVKAALAPGEALVQLWWPPDGQGQALLNAATGLRQTPLPAALATAGWAPLTEAWQAAQRADTHALLDAPDAAQRLGAEIERDTAFAYAWQCMCAPEGVAVATWQWLRDQGALLGCTRLIVVWPADKAAWPWQALVEMLEPPDTGVSMELAAGAAALLRSRRVGAASANSPDGETHHAALFTEDLWSSPHPGETLACRIEASVLPQALRARARRSADAADSLQALQANGLVHLAAHGVYDEDRPWSSHLVLHAPGVATHEAAEGLARRRARRRFVAPQVGAPAASAPLASTASEPVALPVWLIAELKLAQPEVSLSACQVMRTGQGAGAAALRGPVGLGAMLSSAGARSVVGSLWVCDSLAMAVFYERWFHHRTGHDALQALRLARQDVRTMSWAELDRWLDQGLQQAQADGLITPAQQQQLLQTGRQQAAEQQANAWANGRQTGPFVHPVDWAGLCLIGNAPARPDALQRPPSMAVSVPGWQRWLHGFVTLLRSFTPRKPSL